MITLDRAFRGRGREAGIALVEVLMAALVAGIAVAGLALMLGKGNAWVQASGDGRVAAKLAEQKLEHLRSLTFKCVFPGGPQAYPVGTTGPQALQPGCESAAGTQSYTEGPGNTWVAANGTATPQPAPSASIPHHTFTRKTCVQYVTDGSAAGMGVDFTLPPYVGGLSPTTGNCQPYVNTTASPPTSCNALSATCVQTNTKRIVVVVQPTNSAGNSRQESDVPVALAAWLTNVPGGL